MHAPVPVVKHIRNPSNPVDLLFLHPTNSLSLVASPMRLKQAIPAYKDALHDLMMDAPKIRIIAGEFTVPANTFQNASLVLQPLDLKPIFSPRLSHPVKRMPWSTTYVNPLSQDIVRLPPWSGRPQRKIWNFKGLI